LKNVGLGEAEVNIFKRNDRFAGGGAHSGTRPTSALGAVPAVADYYRGKHALD
jgi:hypothetical protein